MQNRMLNAVYKNLANVASILGILPLIVLFDENGYKYIIPLIIYNNFMDDLDGILAKKLDIASDRGMRLDNVCDAFAHTVFIMVIGMHYGGICALASLVASAGIILRIVSRLDPKGALSKGSMTNELMRHTFFILLLSQAFNFPPELFLAAVFALHTVSMLAPFPMSYLLRRLATSAKTVLLVNIILVVAWLLPLTTPFIAPCFFLTYLYSLGKDTLAWSRHVDVSQVSTPIHASEKPK